MRGIAPAQSVADRTAPRPAAPGRSARLTLVALAGAGSLWGLSITYQWPFIGDCWFRALTGWPCAGCGMGRACLALLLGDWAAAVAWHPLAPPFAGALVLSSIWLGADAARGRATFYPALHRATAGPVARLVLLTAVAAAWGWNLGRGGL